MRPGRRLPDGPVYRTVLRPGEYIRDPESGWWWGRPPGVRSQVRQLDFRATVTEHPDGTISVPGLLDAGQWLD